MKQGAAKSLTRSVGGRGKRYQQGLDSLIGMVVYRSYEGNTSLAQVRAKGTPSNHLKILFPIWFAMADITTVQTYRGHVQGIVSFFDF